MFKNPFYSQYHNSLRSLNNKLISVSIKFLCSSRGTQRAMSGPGSMIRVYVNMFHCDQCQSHRRASGSGASNFPLGNLWNVLKTYEIWVMPLDG